MAITELLEDESVRRQVVFTANDVTVAAMDTVSLIAPEDIDQIVVTGSHGGASAGEYARIGGVRCVVCSDAGFGKNDAGVRGLMELDAESVAGVSVAHTSARIGDGLDVWENGIVSYVNETARRWGINAGSPLKEQIVALARGRAAYLDGDAIPDSRSVGQQ